MNIDLTGSRFLQVIHKTDQRTFAGTAGSDYYKFLALFNMQVDAL
jgi:hypothetical protein